jgi:hypothetical protein
VLSASRSDDQLIHRVDLELADIMLKQTEETQAKVFNRIGRSEESLQVERFMEMIKIRKEMPYADAFKMVHQYFTNFKDFEGVLAGVIRAGYIALTQKGNDPWLKWVGKD